MEKPVIDLGTNEKTRVERSNQVRSRARAIAIVTLRILGVVLIAGQLNECGTDQPKRVKGTGVNRPGAQETADAFYDRTKDQTLTFPPSNSADDDPKSGTEAGGGFWGDLFGDD